MEDDLNSSDDLICNSKKELRFIDDGDLLSSDSTDEVSNSESPQKYNQLKPRANLVYKLLSPIRPKVENVWKAVTDSPSSDLLDPHISSNTMAKIKKNNKRKHEEMETRDVLSDEGIQKKRAKKSSGACLVDKKVNRKEQNHMLSSSDAETSPEKFRSKRREKKPLAVSVTVPDTSHLLSSENDSATENTLRARGSNTSAVESVSENDIQFNGQSFQGYDLPESNEGSGGYQHKLNNNNKNLLHNSYSNHLDKSNNKKGLSNIKQNNIKEKELKLSQKEKTEISKFSFLLNENLVEKNNIWLLQCPRNMDCTMMINQYINLNGSCQLEDGESTFEAYSYRNDQTRTATLAVPSEDNRLQLCKIPLSGNIIVEECVKIKNNNSYDIPEPLKCVELPKNLQTRHPLLGTNYENQPRTIERVYQSPKKKKNKHSKHEYRDDLTESEVPPSSIDITRKRKRKESLTKAVDFDTQSSVEESRELKNVKRKKQKKHHRDESLS